MNNCVRKTLLTVIITVFFKTINSFYLKKQTSAWLKKFKVKI